MEVCNSSRYLEGLIPKLSFIYTSQISVRPHELSRLQNTLSIVLIGEHVHKKVCIKSKTIKKNFLFHVRFTVTKSKLVYSSLHSVRYLKMSKTLFVALLEKHEKVWFCAIVPCYLRCTLYLLLHFSDMVMLSLVYFKVI